MVAFKAFLRNMHPVNSLFQRFDYRLKRFMRMCMLLGQVCIITILVWVCYSEEVKKREIIVNLGSYRPFWISFVLGFLTLPLPRCFSACFMTTLYVRKENK